MKSVQSHSLIHKITYVRLYIERWSAEMKFAWAIFFPCACLDIFDEFFDPRYARAEKLVENVSTLVSIVEKYVEKISTSTRKKKLPAQIHFPHANILNRRT